jgi:hypothetical protein
MMGRLCVVGVVKVAILCVVGVVNVAILCVVGVVNVAILCVVGVVNVAILFNIHFTEILGSLCGGVHFVVCVEHL